MIRSNKSKNNISSGAVDGDGSNGNKTTAQHVGLSELAMQATSLLSQVVSFPPPSAAIIMGNVTSDSNPAIPPEQKNVRSNVIPAMMIPRNSYLDRQYHGFDLSLTTAQSPTTATAQIDVPMLVQRQQRCVSANSTVTSNFLNSNGKSDMTFPQRLLQILSDQSIADVISWLPHGQAFVILRPSFLMAYVLPNYFGASKAKSSSKYSSFTRKLNRW